MSHLTKKSGITEYMFIFVNDEWVWMSYSVITSKNYIAAVKCNQISNGELQEAQAGRAVPVGEISCFSQSASMLREKQIPTVLM
jgi:hypothetical protein